MRCPSTVTGTPVRPEFFEQPEYRRSGERLRLLVLGGSQGASRLNELVPAALAALGPRVAGFEVVHQCGPAHVAATEAAYAASAASPAGLEVVPFMDDMAAAMGRASLIVSRAGAITLAEICAVGRASVLIPLALAGAHQADNAAAMAAAGAAEMLDPEVGPNELGSLLQALMESPERLAAMAAAARAQGRPDAVERLADRVEELVVAA
jgi:UDP-N-acetylglucosamine--N-acetylmuramyl-(pentapeptide) pyrophosphoryl-undecaprenol N-acetylglucosamine transferase